MRAASYIYCVVVFCLLGKTTTAQQPGTGLDLKKCIELALNNNLPVQQSGLLVESAEVNLDQARANRLPAVNGDLSYGFNRGRSVDPVTNSYINQQLASSNVGVNAGVTLFNGMKLQNLIAQNKYDLEASKMNWQQLKDSLALNVILAYLQVLGSEDILQIAKGQLEVTNTQVSRLQVLVKEGVVGNYQLTDMNGQLADEKVAIINAESNLEQAKLSLCQLMNINYDPAMKLDRKDTIQIVGMYPSSASEIIANATESLAAIKYNTYKIKSAEKGIKVARAGYSPTVSLFANLGSNYSSIASRSLPAGSSQVTTGDYVVISGVQNPVLRTEQHYTSQKIGYTTQLNNNLGSSAGISIAVPIFNNAITKNRIKQARISLKNWEMEAQNTKQQLQQNVEQAWLYMHSAYERYSVLLQQQKDFEESARSATIRFENGVINSYEFIAAKNNLDRTLINLAHAKYELMFRTALLDFYAGKKWW